MINMIWLAEKIDETFLAKVLKNKMLMRAAKYATTILFFTSIVADLMFTRAVGMYSWLAFLTVFGYFAFATTYNERQPGFAKKALFIIFLELWFVYLLVTTSVV